MVIFFVILGLIICWFIGLLVFFVCKNMYAKLLLYKAAKQGNVNAQKILSLCKAAKQGNAQAQFLLGVMFSTRGDVTQGLKWLRKAAGQGHEGALHALESLESLGLH